MSDGTLDAPLRLAAFALGDTGGNPAGVVFVDAFPADTAMLAVAAGLGFSETAFVRERDGEHVVRYFAPELEVPFCGHATVAAIAALGERHGSGDYALSTPAGPVRGTASRGDDGRWRGGFAAPAASTRPLDPAVRDGVLEAFDLSLADLDPALGPTLVSAGATHVQLGLVRRERLAAMHYDMASFGPYMREHGIVTVNLLWRRDPSTFHSRNAFASGGVFEDPATGAAAAALGGYLRANGQRGQIVVLQGEDMGQPCRIDVTLSGRAPAVHVAGDVRVMESR